MNLPQDQADSGNPRFKHILSIMSLSKSIQQRLWIKLTNQEQKKIMRRHPVSGFVAISTSHGGEFLQYFYQSIFMTNSIFLSLTIFTGYRVQGVFNTEFRRGHMTRHQSCHVWGETRQKPLRHHKHFCQSLRCLAPYKRLYSGAQCNGF